MKMDFDTIEFLANLFSGAPPAVESAPQVGAVAVGLVDPAADPSGISLAPGDTAVVTPESIDLDMDDEGTEEIEPLLVCPVCGTLELWLDFGGRWRCQHCDRAALERSRSLVKKAARLRTQSLAQRQLPAARSGRCSGPVAASGRPGAFTGP
jgi:hypothetical protein